MTAKELQKRNEKSQHLRVIQVDEEQYYVESSEGKICYRVTFEGDSATCTCGDYSRGIKSDPNFKCKHIISVYNCIPAGEVQHGQLLERAKPKLNDRFIIKIENRDFVQYAGLLDLGHQKGISQIEVDPIQLPTQDNGNFAICKATVISKTGDSFTDIGDANPNNCSSKVSKHILRLASTRAIARALRSFTNIGMTCLEELADLSDIAGNGSDSRKPKIDRQAGNRLKPITKPESAPEKPTESRDENRAGQIKTDNPVVSNGSAAEGQWIGKATISSKGFRESSHRTAIPVESKDRCQNAPRNKPCNLR